MKRNILYVISAGVDDAQLASIKALHGDFDIVVVTKDQFDDITAKANSVTGCSIDPFIIESVKLVDDIPEHLHLTHKEVVRERKRQDRFRSQSHNYRRKR